MMRRPASSRWLRAAGGIPGLLRLGLLLALLAAFSLAVPGFLSPRNLYALLQSFALLGLVTIGLSLTMIAGEFDLGVGAMVAVAGLITLRFGGESLLPGIAAALAFGLLVGLANAAVFVWLRVSSLVVTVGTMMTLSGLAFWLAGGRVISTDNFDLGAALDGRLLGVFSLRSLITLAAFAAVGGLLRFTRLGRDILAAGSRPAAARASGVKVGAAFAAAFALSGLCAALAGSLLSVSLATASATMGGTLLLQAASAAIIGGVALSGGVGGAGGVLVGVLALAALNNGLSLLGTGAASIALANGLVLLAVVLLGGKPGAALRRTWSPRERMASGK